MSWSRSHVRRADQFRSSSSMTRQILSNCVVLLAGIGLGSIARSAIHNTSSGEGCGGKTGSREDAKDSSPPTDGQDAAASGGSGVIGHGPFLQLGSALLFLLLFVKAYAVAGFSLTTAGELVATAPVAVLMGTLASYAYFLVPLLFLACAVYVSKAGTRAGDWTKAALTALVIVSFVLSPTPYLLALTVGALVWKGFGRLLFARLRPLRFLDSFASYVSVVLVVFIFITLDRPWVPAEVLTLKSPAIIKTSKGVIERTDQPVVHVLATGDWITALNADTRFIMKIPSADVIQRTICHHSRQPPGIRPIFYEFTDRAYRSPNTSCDTLPTRLP